MSIKFNLPSNAGETQATQRGPQPIGEILPDVLAVYFRRLEVTAAETVAKRRTLSARHAPRFNWPTEIASSPLMAATQ